MKKTLTSIAVAVLLAVIISGIAIYRGTHGGPALSDAGTTSTIATNHATPGAGAGLGAANLDQVYLLALQSQGVNTSGATDVLVSLGKSTCSAFISGASDVTITNVFLSSGFTVQEGGAITGAAIAAYCPQYRSRLDSWGSN